MSEEMNHGVKSIIVMEEEYENGEGWATKSHEQGNPVCEWPPNLGNHEVLTTGNELPEGFSLRGGVGESETVSVEGYPVIRLQEEPISSPVKSFQLVESSQGGEEGMKEAKMIPCISPSKETRVVQFEDTLSEQD